MKNIKIIGTGIYVPEREFTLKELSIKLKTDEETLKKIGVKTRYYVNNKETASYMGALAAKNALKDADLNLEDIDLLVCASGTVEMLIPCTAALIHKELKPQKPLPAFDINSTCLSFLTALDTLSYLVQEGKYRNVLIVSSEIASVGLNYNDLESAALFSDGAAAVIISKTREKESSRMVASHMNTYSEGWEHCKILGGSTGLHSKNWTFETKEMFEFYMNGKGVFKLVSQKLPAFMEQLYVNSPIKAEEIDVFIPHQASLSALKIIQKKLNIPDAKTINIVEDFGNMIAASLPFALHYAIKNEKLKRGDKVLFLGTSAGLSIGGVIIEY